MLLVGYTMGIRSDATAQGGGNVEFFNGIGSLPPDSLETEFKILQPIFSAVRCRLAGQTDDINDRGIF